MATTITPATLTVSITESVSLNNKTYGNTNTLTIANVNEVDERIVTVPTSELRLLIMARLTLLERSPVRVLFTEGSRIKMIPTF
jgi:hypothetical protein